MKEDVLEIEFNSLIDDVYTTTGLDLAILDVVDFNQWWISEVDTNVQDDSISGTPICIIDVYRAWSEENDEFIAGDDELTEIESIFKAIITTMDHDAHVDVIFTY